MRALDDPSRASLCRSKNSVEAGRQSSPTAARPTNHVKAAMPTAAVPLLPESCSVARPNSAVDMTRARRCPLPLARAIHSHSPIMASPSATPTVAVTRVDWLWPQKTEFARSGLMQCHRHRRVYDVEKGDDRSCVHESHRCAHSPRRSWRLGKESHS